MMIFLIVWGAIAIFGGFFLLPRAFGLLITLLGIATVLMGCGVIKT